MRARSLLFSLIALAAALLILAACGGDDDDGGNGNGATDAPTSAPNNGGNGNGGDGNGGAGDIGSASIQFSGEVEGGMELSGMSCDLFPDLTIGSQRVSISGTVGDEQVTIDLSGSAEESLVPVRLTRSGEAFSTWDNQEETDEGLGPAEGSGTATFTDEGGELSFTLNPRDSLPGAATADVSIEGGWTCPGGEYTG